MRLGPEQALRDRERPQRVVCRESSRVADDVRVATTQAEHREDVEPRVHAREDSDLAPGSRIEPRRGELLGACGSHLEHVLGVRHLRVEFSNSLVRR